MFGTPTGKRVKVGRPMSVRRLPLLLRSVVWPASPAAALEAGPAATVIEVVDGDTVVLDDRSQVRLVGLQAPKLPLGRPDFPNWPLAGDASTALRSIVEGARARLYTGGAAQARSGRSLPHLIVRRPPGRGEG